MAPDVEQPRDQRPPEVGGAGDPLGAPPGEPGTPLPAWAPVPARTPAADTAPGPPPPGTPPVYGYTSDPGPPPSFAPAPPAGPPGAGGFPPPGPGGPWAGGAAGMVGPDAVAGDPRRGAGRRRRTVLTVGAVVLVVAALVGGGVALLITSGPGPVPAVSPAAQALLRSALAAAEHSGSFHYVSRATSSGPPMVTVGDAGKTSGRQVITIGPDTFTVLVVGTACYFQGDATEMENQLGLPTTVANAHSGQWISLATGDAPYATVYAAVTAHSALADNIAFVPHRRLAPTMQAGRHVIGVTGPLTNVTVGGQTQKAKGSAHFYIRATKPHLPVVYDEKGTIDGERSGFTMTFSRWGEPVVVDAPAAPVAFASLVPAGTPVPSSGPSLVSA